MTEPRDSITVASAAHHGQGAPSGRRLPTEATAGEGRLEPWPHEATSGSEGAEGEPRVRGEGAQLPGAGSGAEPRDGRARGLSSLDTKGITQRTREKCARRQAWIAKLEEPTREHRRAKAERLRGQAKKRRASLRNNGACETEVAAKAQWYERRALGQEQRISRVLQCGSEVLVVACQDCNAKHERGQGCGASRYCLGCRGVRAAELRGKFLAARADVLLEAASAGLLNPLRRGGRYGDKFLTLTVPHIPTDTIGSRIERVLQAWTRFRRLMTDYFMERTIKRAEWYRVLEWTPGRSDEQGHPHLHVWLFAPYVVHSMLQDWWRSALLTAGCPAPDCASAIIHIREVSDPRSGAVELIKYLTKDVVANGEWLDPHVYGQVITALDGHRQTQGSSGFMSRADKAPRLCEQCHSPLPKLVRRKPGPTP